MTPTVRNLALFAFLWLCIGFALGCATLLGPVRWLVTFAREQHYGDSTENLLVKAVIGIFVALSAWLAYRATRQVLSTTRRTIRFGIPAVCLLLAISALLVFLNPETLQSVTSGSIDQSVPGFTFGPYPSAERMQQLKADGYYAVVSLLHPAVTPFEPMLLAEEKEAAQKSGLTLISIPMLPWVSQNADAVEQIRQLAEQPRGRYYVHCYLGKDRVNAVKRLIADTGVAEVNDEGTAEARSLDDVARFERGPVSTLGDDVYLTPLPTDEEYLGYVVSAGIRHVVSLMDPADPEARERVDEEKVLLKTYGIAFTNLALPEDNPGQLDALLDSLARLPRPLLIHRFFSDREGEKAFAEAYQKRFGVTRNDIPGLP